MSLGVHHPACSHPSSAPGLPLTHRLRLAQHRRFLRISDVSDVRRASCTTRNAPIGAPDLLPTVTWQAHRTRPYVHTILTEIEIWHLSENGKCNGDPETHGVGREFLH